MRKEFVIVFLGLCLVSLVSAGVELTTPANDIYNLGEVIKLPITITADEVLTNKPFSVSLVCGVKVIEIYSEKYLPIMNVGDVQTRDFLSIFLDGTAKGDCYMEYNLGSYSNRLVEKVKISDSINLDLDSHSEKFKPGEKLTLTGTVKKENGAGIDGKIEFTLEGIESADLFSVTEIKGETFSISIDVPTNFKFGKHSVKIYAYETGSSGEILNKGELSDEVTINQVPTTLEVLLTSNKIQPGTSVVAKVILMDQTGQIIDAKVYAAVKNAKDEIVQKIEERTNNEFSYFIAVNQTPEKWAVSAYSEGLNKMETFEILAYPDVDFQIVENKLFVKNTGNVPYNESINLNIGNQTVSFYPELDFGQEKTFYLTAPRGEYLISVGNAVEEVYLTGNAIEISTEFPKTFKLNPVIWIFILVLLVIVIFLLLRRMYLKRARTFRDSGRDYKEAKIKKIKTSKKGGEFKELVALNPKSSSSSSSSGSSVDVNTRQFNPVAKKESMLVSSKIRAELALSIDGAKQDASVMCLGLKNYYDISNGDGNVLETLQSITQMVENERGFIYNSNGAMFILLAPSRTRTSNNESKLLEISNRTKDILKDHNKKFKKKIDFGIALNYGTIVTKEENGILKFMVLGTFSTSAKKVALRANEDICLLDEFRKRLPPSVRTEPKEVGGMKVHVVTKSVLGSSSSTGHSTFLEGFVDRQKRDFAKQETEKQKADLKVPEMPKDEEEFSIDY